MSDERTPLLQKDGQKDGTSDNPHVQFCTLIGIPPSNLPPGAKHRSPAGEPLYHRASHKRAHQKWTYLFTATLSNTLLLAQVVLGAALTALGASSSSHILITIFGAANTVIAGIVAYLKSRGQPMRAKMFLNDLERVMDEIENSEIMWLGISKGVHGYDEIASDETVSVRSEVARLTRLYDHAVKSNTINDPDLYAGAGSSDKAAGVKVQPSSFEPQTRQMEEIPMSNSSAPVPAAPALGVPHPDESPLIAKPKPPPLNKNPPTDPPKKTGTVTTANGMPTETSKTQGNAASKDHSQGKSAETSKDGDQNANPTSGS